jgi:ribose 5-phosphate isomerase A
VVTDNGNHILDCRVESLPKPAQINAAIQEIPGVLGTGLFLGMADTVIVQDGERVEVRERK